jgi:hypothetical protein
MEYAILFCVVLSALMIMQVYVKRAYQGRLKQEADSLGPQYAPRHTASLIVTETNTTSETCTGGTCRGANIPDGMTVTWAGTNTTLNRHEAVDAFATED